MTTPIPRTIVHRLHEQASRLLDRPALWTRRSGTWVPTSWREYARRVEHLALGLIDLGLKPKQAVTITSFNREEWVVSALAVTAAGGVPVGIYTTSSPEQVAYVTGHCEAPIALVENGEHLAKLESVKGQLPHLKAIVVFDPPPRTGEGLHAYQDLLERGSRLDDAEYFARVEALRPDDLAGLIYTSGTTGRPKGVMLSHRNTTWTAAQLADAVGLGEGEVVLSYLPLSHIAEQACSLYGPVLMGMEVYFAESFDRLADNLKEVRPTVFFGVPRVWEKFKGKAEGRMNELPTARRRLVEWARRVALEYHDAKMHRRQASIVLEAEYQVARRLVFDPLKARIGLDRARLLATSAAPISREVLDFFASVDLVLREVYGQSEVTGPTSVNTPTATRLGTLGRPMAGVEVRIAEDGEILVRGENVCQGYYKDEAATRALIQDGWLHSGDVGQLDDEGFLRITGRKKEIIVTSGGKKTAPAGIEGLLKAIDPVGNALVVGDNRNYLVALIALDPEKAEAFSRKRALPLDPAALAASGALRDHLTQRIEEDVNPKLARFETIKRFEVLPGDFTIEGGELTSTLKVRRQVVQEKYAALIERLYAVER